MIFDGLPVYFETIKMIATDKVDKRKKWEKKTAILDEFLIFQVIKSKKKLKTDYFMQ